MATIAVIPARAGSKRVYKKNQRLFQGMSLVSWALRAAQSCADLDEVIISSDDDFFLTSARDFGAQFYPRPANLSGDFVPTIDVLHNVCAIYKEASGRDVDTVVLLQPTSPLRAKGLIDEGLRQLRSDRDASALIAVHKVRMFTGTLVDGCWVGDYPPNTRSQEIPDKYVPTGALFVYRYRHTIAKRDPYGHRVLPFVQPSSMVVNIDDEKDFEILENVYRVHKDQFSHLIEGDSS